MAPATSSTNRKVTTQRKNKLSVVKSRSKSNSTKNLMQALTASIPQAMAALDGRRRIMLTNAAFDRMFGASNPGDRLSDFFDPKGLKDIFKQCARTSRSVEKRELIDTPKNESDPEVSYSVTVTPHSDADLKSKFLLLIDDTTEGSDREDRMIANSRLVSVGEMAAGVAHELNNPLTAVLGFSQLAMRQATDDTLKRDLESIADEAERAGRIVDNLLTFARSSDTFPDSQTLNITDSLQKILNLREYECRVNNVEVVTYFGDETPLTLADAHRMEQVFMNLIGNSIHAIGESVGHGTITVGVVHDEGRIRVSITDDGPGISPANQKKIFEPFFTTKPIGKGTGLGLSICKGIVEDHGGAIKVESAAGRGTTFVVEIPIIEVPEEVDAPSLSTPAQPNSYTKLKILAVDDERSVTMLLNRALVAQGHDVDVAHDGAEALRTIFLNEYDAILLDVRMPGLGGAEVYRSIEVLRPDLADRVMFITGDTVSPDTRTFLEQTRVEVLHKPFSLEELRHSMDKYAVLKEQRPSEAELYGRPDLSAGITRMKSARKAS
ncbi:response regulator [Candidatus Lucifugimonas marina]|uniref:histidine kinase n=1 Tax=Candidatus Lucifugimonas marina TaxID=3038979 RepID=A0AAJ5ZIP2_9CHLR|nr:response regulator [SAR202 cluster bacterium JH702]WFG36697.1 response regulator [SAR202 cluster bacterium JH545]WFG40631.1 response regulator [SAR202 cluster bacterium JH1073]